MFRIQRSKARPNPQTLKSSQSLSEGFFSASKPSSTKAGPPYPPRTQPRRTHTLLTFSFHSSLLPRVIECNPHSKGYQDRLAKLEQILAQNGLYQGSKVTAAHSNSPWDPSLLTPKYLSFFFISFVYYPKDLLLYFGQPFYSDYPLL